ncbi:hypothetical protein [Photobacterium carnosum]|uniref:hypothetical protein n=1 Tax=Photobacterium carnosum TaxID=2023717 RepID=UPI001E511D69|nr:hypothetical protein [Photobacterium carnosum]MCD9496763.1 hypothetical protein [Photobacterium carnosum]
MSKEIDFSYWPFTRYLCVEKLKFTQMDNPALSYNLEWIELSIETFAVEYSKSPSLPENVRLLESIAASFDRVSNRGLVNAVEDNPQCHKAIADVIKATLCLTLSLDNLERINRLYSLMPRVPSSALLDAYIMYQVTFGYTNLLDDWDQNFERYSKTYGWNTLSRSQIDYGITLVKQSAPVDESLKQQLAEQIKMSSENSVMPITAQSRLNWLAFLD